MKNILRMSVAAFMAFAATSCCNCDKQKACPKSSECEKMECPKECPSECPNSECPNKEERPECPMKGERQGCPKGENGMRGPRHHRNPMDRPDLTPEQKEKFAMWMNFDSLTVEEQKALLAERKAEIDERDSIHKARKAEFEEKWNNFDKLSVEEQKALLDMKGHGPFLKPRMGKPHGGPHGDKHHGKPHGERK